MHLQTLDTSFLHPLLLWWCLRQLFSYINHGLPIFFRVSGAPENASEGTKVSAGVRKLCSFMWRWTMVRNGKEQSLPALWHPDWGKPRRNSAEISVENSLRTSPSLQSARCYHHGRDHHRRCGGWMKRRCRSWIKFCAVLISKSEFFGKNKWSKLLNN